MINFKFELVKVEKFSNPSRERYEFHVKLNHGLNKGFTAIVMYSDNGYGGVQHCPNSGEETLPYPGNFDTHMFNEALRIYCSGLRGTASYIWVGEIGEYVGGMEVF